MIILGIDIGGSATKGALVDTSTGKLVSERIRYGNRDVLEPKAVIKIITNIMKDLNYEGSIGVGFPGVVNHGLILTAANLHKNWVGVNLQDLLKAKTGQESIVINDADAAGLAEIRFGVEEASVAEVVLFLTIGTGIGSAIFVKGNLMPNTELGHLQIRGKDAEHRASAAVKRVEKLSWKKWAIRFDEALHVYEFLLNPDLIVLGGGISSKFDRYAKYFTVETKVIPAKLENLAGIIGAAMAAQEGLQFD